MLLVLITEALKLGVISYDTHFAALLRRARGRTDPVAGLQDALIAAHAAAPNARLRYIPPHLRKAPKRHIH